MRIGRKSGRSDKAVPARRKIRAALKDAAKTAIEKLEDRQLLTAVFYDNFDSGASSFSGNFMAATDLASAFSYSATTGILDQGSATGTATAGGGVTATGTDNTALYTGGTTSLADGLVHTISMMVKGTDTNAGNKPLQLGWVAATNQSFNGTEGAITPSFISARLYGDTQVGTQSANAGGSTTGTNINFTTPATAGDWLQLTVTAQETDTTNGVFTITFGVTDYGQNGTSPPVVLLAPQTATETSVGMAGIAGVPGWRGSTQPYIYDNFSLEPSTTAPAAPVLNTATAGNGQVGLSWSAVTGATSYTVLRSTSTGTETPLAVNIASTSFTDTTAVDGTTYFYTIQADQGTGASVSSNELSAKPFAATPPTQITGVTAEGDNSSVIVNWTLNSSAASYIILRAPYNNTTQTVTGPYAQLTPGTSATNTYIDSTAANGSYYSYEVEGVNPAGIGPASAAAVAEPVNSSFYDNFDSGASSFTSNFAAATDSGTLAGAFTYGTTTGILDQGTATGGGGVTATGADNTAVYTGATTPLADGLVHTISTMIKDSDTNTGNKPLQLGWTASTNQSFNGTEGTVLPNFISARIYGDSQVGTQSGNAGGTSSGTNINFNTAATAGDWLQLTVTAQETSTTAGTFNVNFQVTDYGQNGTSPGVVLLPFAATPYVETSAGMAGIPGVPGWRGSTSGYIYDNFSLDLSNTAPAAPVFNTATAGNNLDVLSWSAVAGANSYTVLRGTSTGTETPLAVNIAATSYTDTTVTDGTTYYYTIQADNGTGASISSNELSVTPSAATPPTQVTGVAAAGANGSVTVSWALNSSATSYIILRAPYNNTTQMVTGPYVQLTPGTSTTNTYTDSTVTNGTYYSYEVEGVDASGTGPASAAVVTEPLAPTTTTVNFNNGPTDETNNFVVDHDGVIDAPGTNQAGSTNPQNFAYNATAGVDDGPGGAAGGGLTTANLDMNLNYDASAYNLAAGGGATVSVFFEETSNPGTARIAQLGFMNLLNSSFNSDNASGATGNTGVTGNEPNGTTPLSTTFIGIRPYGNGQFEAQYKLPGSETLTVIPLQASTGGLPNTPGGPFEQGEWYQISFTLAETGPGSGMFNYVATINDYGTTGTATPTVLETFSSSAPISLPGFDSTNGSGPDVAWAAVRQVTDQPNLDNFSVTGVPAVGVGPPAPTLSATGNTNDVILSWTQSAGATSYNILRGSSATNLTPLTTVTGVAGTNTYSDTTAVTGTPYVYEVVPVHNGINGASNLVGNASNAVNITPTAAVPGQVTGLSLMLATGSVTAAWTPVNFATGYQIWRAPVVNGTVGTYVQVGTTTGATTFTDNSTTDPTSPPSAPNIYSYYVIATNTTGPGAASAAVQANFFNGAEDFIYNDPFWKSPDQTLAAPTPGYTEVGLNYDAEQLVPTADVTGGTGVSPVVGNPTFPSTNFSQVITGKITLTDADLGLAAGDTTDTAAVTLGMISDDGGALYVGGILEASDTVYGGGNLTFINGTTTGGGGMQPLQLTAGTYDFQLFEAQAGGGWVSEMEWSTPKTEAAAGVTSAMTTPNTFVVVPQASLIVQTGAPQAPQALALNGTPAANDVPLTWTNYSGNELEEIVQRSTTSTFAAGTVTNVATLPMNNVNETSAGSTSTGSYTDAINNGTQNEWYRILSVNLDDPSGMASNVLAVPSFVTTVPAGLETHFYNNQYWGSGTQAANAQVTGGINLTGAAASGAVTSIDANGTSASGPTLNSITLNGTDFSDVYTGKLVITTGGAYTFQINTSDPGNTGALYINGALVASSNGNTTTSNPITLTAAGNYDFVFYHSQATGATWTYDVQYSGPDTGGTAGTPVYEDITALTQASDVPSAVTNLAATSPDAAHVVLTWTANTDGTLNYIIQRSTSPTFASGVTTFTTGITSNSYTDASVLPGTQYYYRIQAANFDGSSAESSNVTITTSTTLATPTNVTVQQGGFDNVVKFIYNTTAPGLGSFSILRSTNGGAFSMIATAPASATTFLDTSLPNTTAGTQYAYEVQANATGAESSSTISTASPTETLIVVTGTMANPLTIPATGPGPLTLNGAVVNSSGLELTDGGGNEAHSAFGTSGFPATGGFSTTFDFQFTDPDSDPAADAGNGFAFVLQSDSPTAVGGNGAGYGYTGILNSLAIVFNQAGGVTQTGLALNGAAPVLANMNTGSGGAFGNAFQNVNGTFQTDVFDVSLTYSTLTNELTETVVDTGSPAGTGTSETYTATYPISATQAGSLAGILGNSGAYAYAGFTGGTGTAVSTQNVTNWNFTVTTPPAVTGVSPNTGPIAGGTPVTITGTNFTGATAVTFGNGALATNVVVNPAGTQITCVTPMVSTAGLVNVVVTTPSGASATVTSDQFTYVSATPPTVVSVTTNDGEGDGNTAQASEVRQLVVNFSQAVNLTQPGAFSLGVYNLTGTGGAVSGNGSNDGSITDISSVLNTATSSNGGLTWTITFAPGTSNTDANANASLIDGIYSFSINNSDVTSNGVALTGSNTYTFHRLFGDVTGTGAVNNTDARDFSKAYAAAFGSANYNAALDFGGAGANINNTDARDFSLRYGHSFSSVLPAGGIN